MPSLRPALRLTSCKVLVVLVSVLAAGCYRSTVPARHGAAPPECRYVWHDGGYVHKLCPP